MGAQVFFNAWDRLWVPTCSLTTGNVYVGAHHSPWNQPLSRFHRIGKRHHALMNAIASGAFECSMSKLAETGVTRASIIVVLHFSKS
jgi:hypothetical protein